MQDTGIVEQVLALFQNPLILIATIWVIGIFIAVAIFRKPKGPKAPLEPKKQKTSKVKVKGHLIKQMQKMSSETEKNKDLSVPPVRSRQEIITQMFESKTGAIGLEASTASGYVPVSHTPLAKYLKERAVAEDTVSAIIAGLMEEVTEDNVRSLIEGVAGSINLVGNELDIVKELAVEEWRNVRKTDGS